MKRLIDTYGRHVDYLRISVTDHCNLRCSYCTPFSGRAHLPRSEILSYEEMFTVAKAAVMTGITKIRITGGEPLVRKGLAGFCKMLSGINGLESLALTTNGVLLKEFAQPLFEAGVRRVNVSLDTLKPQRFKKLTGGDHFLQVVSGIRRAEEVGFSPVKINTVVMRSVNDDEIEDLANLTLKKPYHVRFIELMPTKGWMDGNHNSLYFPIDEIMKRIRQIGGAQVGPASDTFGPARLCILPGALGKVGFIAPLGWHFCGSCNRIRLTADGKLKSCLFSEEEIDIKGHLRAGAAMDELVDIFRRVVVRKPDGHHLNQKKNRSASARPMMRAIGG
jgi:cyclic pyranopterin phosphate synthase